MKAAVADAEPANEQDDDFVEKVLSGEDRFLAPIEVAHVLLLEQATVQQMCRDGKIKATKVNGHWRITASEVRRFVLHGPAAPESKGN